MRPVRRLTEWLRRKLWGDKERREQKDQNEPPDGGSTIHHLPPHTHGDLIRDLRVAVRCGRRQEQEVLLQTLREQYPVPTTDVVRKEVWGWTTDRLVIRTHAKADVADAVRNVESTGRKVTSQDCETLSHIMLHSCWWSPTGADHRNDAWVRYLRFTYRLVGLQPILDSLIWPNEIAQYPLGHPPLPPWLFLLSTATKFYVFNFQDGCMMDAGDTLQEVLDGLREERWHGEMSWKEVPEQVEEDPGDYFPVYDNVPHTEGEHELMREVREFEGT